MVPELALWWRAMALLALLVLALIGAGLVFGPPPSLAFRDFNLQRLQAFRTKHDPRDPQALRVVMLGNSRLKNATIEPAVFDRLAGQYGFRRVEHFRLVANWAVFSNFAPLLEDVRELQPDVYVIQMDLLVQEMAPTFENQLKFNYLRWLASGNGPWSWYEPEGEQLGLVCTTEKEPEQRASRAGQKLLADPESESPRLARRFIREVTAAGARVMLVSVPKTRTFEGVLPSASEEMLVAAGQLAAESPRVIVAPFTDPLPDDHFCDVTHLNRQGATAYSQWLIGRLATMQLTDAER